jgi:hypothetical protein
MRAIITTELQKVEESITQPMETTGKRTVLFFASLSVIDFLVNFCWESLHGLLYKAHPAMSASVYVPMMLSMAVMDTVAITALYSFTALISRSWFWTPGLPNSLIFIISGIVLACGVEYISIFILHLWQYGPSMPVLFGVGLFPSIQLSSTGFFSVIIARKVSGVC